MRNFFVLFLIINLSACGEQSDFEKASSEYVNELKWILKASPKEDFHKALNKEDYRFLGVYGINNPIPNVSKECINLEKDVKYLKGTSEVLIGYEHSKLNAVAYIYSEHYNILMLDYLKTNKGFKCNL